MKRQREDDSFSPNVTEIRDVGFEALRIERPGVCGAIAKSRQGKSKFIEYVASELQDEIDYVIGISRTAFDEGNLTFIPKRFKFTSWPGEITRECPRGKTKQAILNMIDEQLKIPKSERPLGMLVIEDEYKSLRDPVILEIVTRPTHYNIFVLVAVNWLNKMAPDFREGLWKVALFKMTSKKSIAAAYDAFGEDCYDIGTFQRKLQGSTGQYKFLFKDLKGTTDNHCEWGCFRAPKDIPKFMIEPKIHAEEKEE